MEQLARTIKALSEEIRLRILALLRDGELCVCDLMAVLGLPQSTISRHLSYLRQAGWIDGERRGVWMYYRLARRLAPRQANLLQALAALLIEETRVKEDLKKLTAYQKTKQPGGCD